MNFENQPDDSSSSERSEFSHSQYRPSGQTPGIVEAEVLGEQPGSPPQRQRLSVSGLLAWVLVLGFTGVLFFGVAISQFTTAPQVGGDASTMELMQVQLQAKGIVAQRELSFMSGSVEVRSSAPEVLNAGPYEQRLCYSILLNELEGAEKANEYLDDLEDTVEVHELELTEDQLRLKSLVRDLIEQYESGNPDSSSVPEPDREFLESKLQWLGKLALFPVGTPQKTERSDVLSEATGILITSVVGMLAGLAACFLGFLLAILFVVMLASRKVRSGFLFYGTDHNIYIETFAIWMLIFFGISIALGWFDVVDPQYGLLLQPFIFFGSLIALVWPVVRGIPFSQVRQDIGWTARNPIKEVLLAVPAYLTIIPFLIPGIILAAVLVSILSGVQEAPEFARQVAPGHPIQDYIAEGGAATVFLIFLTACIAAPVVEETMFRGVLYRHLRGLTANWQRWASLLMAAIVNGVIFASIHPQGIFGVPMLTTLAIGFSFARETRGSLVSPMVMHGIHNSLVTCVMLIIL